MHISKRSAKKECRTSDILKVHTNNMQQVNKIKYLGDFLNSEGSVSDTLSDRINKSIGLRSQLKSIISDISLGSYHFEVSMIMRESMYLNSILFNADSWYYLNKKQIESLEAVDSDFLQICFKSHSRTVRDAYYAETGKLKIRHIIAKRRLMFLHNILRRNPSQLIYKIYQAQTLKMVRNDWFQTIQNDKKTYDISLSDEEIRLLSKSKFKQLIERKINFKAFTDILNSRKVKIDGLLKCLKLNKMEKFLCKNT